MKIKFYIIIIISENKSIEINCSGFKYGLNSTLPEFDLIERYKELGGENLSLGSDAHSIDFISYRFNEIIKRIKGIGFNNLVYYENRELKFYKI
ncbi:MAG: hypothetical protein ABF289_08415 [Clostridiales bacterium]